MKFNFVNGMKKLSTLLIATFIVTVAIAQDGRFISIFHKYEKADNCSSVEMSSKMISMLAKDTDNAVLADQLRGIKSIITLTVPVACSEFQRECAEYVNYCNLKKLASNYSGGVSDEYYFHDGYDNTNSIFLMISNNGTKYTAVYIYGKFDIKHISKLSQIAK
jgi:hypothetical protein